MPHPGMPLASSGGHFPHTVPVALAPFVQPIPVAAQAPPAPPTIPPTTMGPDGKPVYPDLSLRFPEVGADGLYMVLPRRQENYPHVPFFTRKQYMDYMKKQEVTVPGKTARARRGRPRKDGCDPDEGKPKLSLPFVTNVWGVPVSNERAEYMRATGRSWWQTALDEGRAPETWRYGANVEIIEEFYRFMYQRFPELALAEDHWKLEWICIHGYPSFKQERRAQFEALARKRAAETSATTIKDKIVDTEKKRKKDKKKQQDHKKDKGKGKARDNGDEEPGRSSVHGSPSLEGALFQMPSEEDYLRPVSPPPLALPSVRKRSSSPEPSMSHVGMDSNNVDSEPSAKRPRLDAEDHTTHASDTLPSSAPGGASSSTACDSMPAPTMLPQGTRDADVGPESRIVPQVKLRNPLDNMWGNDSVAAAKDGAPEAQASPQAPSALAGPGPGPGPLAERPGDGIAPSKKRKGAAKASKACKSWPPTVEEDDRPNLEPMTDLPGRARCARLWATLNEGVATKTCESFDAWYKTMDDRQRKRWYSQNSPDKKHGDA
ncbi:hypothetical protein C8T65DRAFT_703069 [Cerioporus squamosus]|nr:hypothetical protein C8T65DRAFT_703069 [Cerioporus squamosus]